MRRRKEEPHFECWGNLKRKDQVMTVSEDEYPAELYWDGTITIDNESTLLCLYLGSSLGLALCKASRKPSLYQRVGLIVLPERSTLPRHMKIKQVDLI